MRPHTEFEGFRAHRPSNAVVLRDGRGGDPGGGVGGDGGGQAGAERKGRRPRQ